MQNPEIANLLDITPKTASMRIDRSKLMLQEMLVNSLQKFSTNNGG